MLIILENEKDMGDPLNSESSFSFEIFDQIKEEEKFPVTDGKKCKYGGPKFKFQIHKILIRIRITIVSRKSNL